MPQLNLYRQRLGHRIHDRIISHLLWMANTKPPTHHRDWFYELKGRLLRRFGAPGGEEIQRITKWCWNCEDKAAPELFCPRCDGTGIFAVKYVRLRRWYFCGRIFMEPIELMRARDVGTVTIEGRVEHPNLGRRPNEAALWLALLYDRAMFRSMLRMFRPARPTLLPLCMLQYITFGIRKYREQRLERSESPF